MERINRQKNILSIISKLDITPTMYNNAVNKYNELAKHLTEHGIRAEIYPQGSFALGTVVRPIIKDENAAYDLDFVCQVYDDKNSLTAAQLRQKVQNILETSKLYNDNLKICDECFTIVFADIDGTGFSIDIVPAVAESSDKIVKLHSLTKNTDLVDTAIAIPKKEHSNYSWLTNNPKGYKKWFDDINMRFNDATFIETSSSDEAKFECQKQNKWWDEKLTKFRLFKDLILFVILLFVFVIVVKNSNPSWIRIVFSSIIIIRLIERIITNLRYMVLSIQISGAVSILENNKNEEQLLRLQEKIDAKRELSVVGWNFLHSKFAKRLTEAYESLKKM